MDDVKLPADTTTQDYAMLYGIGVALCAEMAVANEIRATGLPNTERELDSLRASYRRSMHEWARKIGNSAVSESGSAADSA